MAGTQYIFIPGANFQKWIFQIYKTQLLSGHCSNSDIFLLLLAKPVTSHITDPEFIKRCHYLMLAACLSLEGLVLFTQVDYLRFMF